MSAGIMSASSPSPRVLRCGPACNGATPQPEPAIRPASAPSVLRPSGSARSSVAPRHIVCFQEAHLQAARTEEAVGPHRAKLLERVRPGEHQGEQWPVLQPMSQAVEEVDAPAGADRLLQPFEFIEAQQPVARIPVPCSRNCHRLRNSGISCYQARPIVSRPGAPDASAVSNAIIAEVD
jgi:hypothetical protein